jgi:phosphodiesterase/alkaline phosphatase D-like protein
MTIRAISRRGLLQTAAATTAMTALGPLARTSLSRAADRPTITHGLQSGDASLDSAVVWARADRPSRMTFEIATSDKFNNVLRTLNLDALPESDFAVKALIDELPSGQAMFYRVTAADLSSLASRSEPVIGRFRTAPADRRSVSFVWSGDTAGQGWGIDEARGGMRIYGTMRRLAPELLAFIKRARIRNTVWLTADVHYTAAHYYDPNRAVFQDFDPFWEFVSGPLNAGTFGPGTLDNTFGPQLRFVKAPAEGQGQNLPPTLGLQFFGHVAIDGGTETMTVTLKDWDDRSLWSTVLEPRYG